MVSGLSQLVSAISSNSGKQGSWLPVDQADIEVIWKELENNPGAEITVDLENRLIECGSISTRFQIDDYTRWRLMEGLDDIGLTLRNEAEITEFEKTRPSFKPKTLPAKLSEV